MNVDAKTTHQEVQQQKVALSVLLANQVHFLLHPTVKFVVDVKAVVSIAYLDKQNVLMFVLLDDFLMKWVYHLMTNAKDAVQENSHPKLVLLQMINAKVVVLENSHPKLVSLQMINVLEDAVKENFPIEPV